MVDYASRHNIEIVRDFVTLKAELSQLNKFEVKDGYILEIIRNKKMNPKIRIRKISRPQKIKEGSKVLSILKGIEVPVRISANPEA